MKPLNYKKRRKINIRFVLIFLLTLLLIFWSSYFTIFTAKKGILILEKRHAKYNVIFEKQAAITFEINEITKLLYKLRNKSRSLNEHKQFQNLISNLRANVEEEIREGTNGKNDFELYQEILNQVKSIQSIIDTYEEEEEEYRYNKELLEKCREKYRQESILKNKK